MPRYLLGQLAATPVPATKLVARPTEYGSALTGPKSQASAWNFVAAAAATAMGLEARSVLGTISGAAWMASQAEAWVDDQLKAGTAPEDLAGEAGKNFDWRTFVGLAILGISVYRTVRRPAPLAWRWV